jgi:hypothetical protein
MALLAPPPQASAQAGGSYTLTWSTIDGGGGGPAVGGAYSLRGTAGQADAGPMSGAAYVLRGGFWSPDVSIVTAVGESAPAPGAFFVRPAMPNPFSASTSLDFSLPDARRVRIDVFDVAGRLVRTLAALELPAGIHRVHWNGRTRQGARAAAGIYLVRFAAGSDRRSQRIVLLD